jgi:hypothetical protein
MGAFSYIKDLLIDSCPYCGNIYTSPYSCKNEDHHDYVKGEYSVLTFYVDIKPFCVFKDGEVLLEQVAQGSGLYTSELIKFDNQWKITMYNGKELMLDKSKFKNKKDFDNFIKTMKLLQ